MAQSDGDGGNLEQQKFYSSKDTYCGHGPFVKKSLIREFAEDCNLKYSEFVQK